MKTTMIILLLTIGLTIFSCKDKSVNSVDQIIGSYKAIVFREPGSQDGGVDILAKGGMLTTRLLSDLKAEGKLVIPDNIGSNFAPTDMNYNGTFTFDADSVHFKNTQTLLDYYSFIRKGTRLETPDMIGRMASFKIILEKE